MDKQCEMDKCFEFLKTQSERTDRINRWLQITIIFLSIVIVVIVASFNCTMRTMTQEYFGYTNPAVEQVQSEGYQKQSIGGE